MKRFLKSMVVGAVAIMAMTPAMAQAADADTAALLEELRALKAKVSALEQRLGSTQSAAKKAQDLAVRAHDHSVKVSSQVQEASGSGFLSDLSKRVSVTGAVEFETFYESFKPNGGDSTSTSGFELATAEVIFEVGIHKYAKGVIHFLWEEGDDAIGLDEGFIILGQTDDMPLYAMVGRMYPAIGVFDSWFISDPLTLEAFETQATALEVGYSHEWFSIGVGGYNGDVHARDDGDDNNINTFFARLNITPPAEALGGIGVTFGFAYTNNIASNNALAEVVAGTLELDDAGEWAASGDGTVDSLVGGYSASLLVEYGMFALAAEYITAATSFDRTDLTLDAGGKEVQPYAYNIELAVMPIEPLTIALRYGGTGDMFDFLPEQQYGITAAYNVFENVTVAVQYLRSTFSNDDESDLFTGQVALEF